MPYISQQAREQLKTRGATDPGELNYLITLEIMAYFKTAGSNYQAIHRIRKAITCHAKDEQHPLVCAIGAICDNIPFNIPITVDDVWTAADLAFLEFYRRVVAPYEDNKQTQNGDVYGT